MCVSKHVCFNTCMYQNLNSMYTNMIQNMCVSKCICFDVSMFNILIVVDLVIYSLYIPTSLKKFRFQNILVSKHVCFKACMFLLNMYVSKHVCLFSKTHMYKTCMLLIHVCFDCMLEKWSFIKIE